MTSTQEKLAQALWRVYNRPERPTPWAIKAGNLPWDDPDFSRRMLREHLDESHGAASRVNAERVMQLDWMWPKLGLAAGARVLDITCGPGFYAAELAGRGCQVTGVDFGPASIAHARELAAQRGVAERCTFVEADVRQMAYRGADFDAALFLYGQLAVFSIEEARALLNEIAASLRPGGRLVIELLNQDRVDKQDSNWWFTDDQGLWGDTPFLHLGERFWNPELALSIERYQILDLDTGELAQIELCDQTYVAETMTGMIKEAGFSRVMTFPAWDGVPLYDADEWIVYLAER